MESNGPITWMPSSSKAKTLWPSWSLKYSSFSTVTWWRITTLCLLRSKWCQSSPRKRKRKSRLRKRRLSRRQIRSLDSWVMLSAVICHGLIKSSFITCSNSRILASSFGLNAQLLMETTSSLLEESANAEHGSLGLIIIPMRKEKTYLLLQSIINLSQRIDTDPKRNKTQVLTRKKKRYRTCHLVLASTSIKSIQMCYLLNWEESRL